MQVRVKGTNRHGVTEISREISHIPCENFGKFIRNLHRKFPNAIHMEINIAFHDPEAVAVKSALSAALIEGASEELSFFEMTERLFNNFNIKMLEKKDA